MAFDDSKYYAPALNGDVAGVAIITALGLGSIAFALEALSRDDKEELAKRIADIRKQADALDLIFNRLTGYTPGD